MTTTTIQVDLVHQECGGCGTVFGISRDLYDRRQSDKKSWWCPNGHRRHYLGESHEQKVERLEANNERDRAYGIRQRDRADANHRTSTALKGHVTRLRNRAAEGRCQWCDEVIDDMAQHVATTHPERAGEEGQAS